MPRSREGLSALERFLCLFTEVRPGEGRTAILMFANVFLILCCYYFIKPLREGWIAISDVTGLDKWQVKAYSSFLQSVLLLGVVGAYGRLATRWSRRELVTRSSLFCLANIFLFWIVYPGMFFEHLPVSGIAFYLWIGLFGVFVVAQFWAFAADIYDDDRGRRMMPMIAIGATAGAVGGSWIGEQLVGSGLVATRYMLLAAMLPLAASVVLSRAVEARENPGGHVPRTPAPAVHPSAMRLVLKSRFLFAVATITLMLSWVNTNGENLLFRVVQQNLAGEAVAAGIADGRAILEFTSEQTFLFYSDFYFWVNVFALLLQAFVASRLLKYGGFGAILMMMPVIALVSYSAMAIVPVLAIVKIMKIAENSTDYSINNTARHVLWLPVDSEAKFKGKPTIDALVQYLSEGEPEGPERVVMPVASAAGDIGEAAALDDADVLRALRQRGTGASS